MRLDKALEIIKQFEGLRLKSYMCPADVPTIGYGSTRYADGTPVKLGQTITEAEAHALLEIQARECLNDIQKLIKLPQSESQLNALVSFVFNVGIGNFKKSTMLKLINAGRPASEVALQFARWNKANGKELKGLTTRRAAEARLYLS